MARFDIECTNCNAKYILFEKPNFQFMKCRSCEEPINLEEFLKGVDEFNMKKIYIAGTINGEPNFKAKFKAVEEELTKQGHAVLNPAELPSGLHYEDYMDICFAMLDVADTIYLLHDYKDSPGALRELERAKRKGKEIVYPTGTLTTEKEIIILRKTNSIYRNFIYKLCEGLLKEIEKDGYCRMIVSEEEVVRMMEKVKDYD